jgi:hypothetical protein
VLCPLVHVGRDHAVQEATRGQQGGIAERSVADPILRGQETLSEALRVADDRIDPCFLDAGEYACRLIHIHRERLLDEHREPAVDRGQDRIDVKVLVGRDDHRGDLGPLEELAVVLRDEVGPDLLCDKLASLRPQLGKADPLDLWVPRSDIPAECPNAAAADDRQADALGWVSTHQCPGA